MFARLFKRKEPLPQPAQSHRIGTTCERCHSINPVVAKFCSYCGESCDPRQYAHTHLLWLQNALIDELPIFFDTEVPKISIDTKFGPIKVEYLVQSGQWFYVLSYKILVHNNMAPCRTSVLGLNEAVKIIRQFADNWMSEIRHQRRK